MSGSQRQMTYKEAGVDVERGDQASDLARVHARRTFRTEVKEQAGTILFNARFSEYKHPELVAACDGVGTKLKLAFISGNHRTVGIDLVAMCVNDLIRRGAEPLFFAPYLAMARIDLGVADALADGISKGCSFANCSVTAGETAELSDFYRVGEYDLAGTAVGVVDAGNVVSGENISAGDTILGLASSGLHSNGYSLVRKVLLRKHDLEDRLPSLDHRPLIDVLLEPTRIYVHSMLALLKEVPVHGIAHITGGGITGKITRIMPVGLTAVIERHRWQPHPIFSLVQSDGEIEIDEMFRTFNMGIGMALVLPSSYATNATSILSEFGETVIELGNVRTGNPAVTYVDGISDPATKRDKSTP